MFKVIGFKAVNRLLHILLGYPEGSPRSLRCDAVSADCEAGIESPKRFLIFFEKSCGGTYEANHKLQTSKIGPTGGTCCFPC